MKLGHTHIKVRNLDRSVQFYCTFLDLIVTERIGSNFVFLTSGEPAKNNYALHHEIALQRVPTSASTPERFSTGLFHIAFEVPTRKTFAAALLRLRNAQIPVSLVDHRISWAMYFADPDDNGLEIYWDTRFEVDGTMLWNGQDRPLTEEQIFSHRS